MKNTRRLLMLTLVLALLGSICIASVASAVTITNSTASISTNFPSTITIKKGQMYRISGVLQLNSRSGYFTQVEVRITDSKGRIYTSGVFNCSAQNKYTKYNLLGVDHLVHFEYLPVGSYRLIVLYKHQATNTYYIGSNMTLANIVVK